MSNNKHWTERSIEDFVHRITFDFTNQIEEAAGSQASLARSLGVSKGRVSQILSSHSIGLKNIVKSARAIGKKVAIVLYDDNDPENTNGPVNSQVFSTCWDRAGKPADFFDLQAFLNEDFRIFDLAHLPEGDLTELKAIIEQCTPLVSSPAR